VDPLLLFAIPGLIDFREKYDQGYRVLDFRISYRILPELKVAILANNVLNEVYSLRPGLLEAPRNLAFRLDWDL
jgi:iron complex outermembrane receptor protein